MAKFQFFCVCARACACACVHTCVSWGGGVHTCMHTFQIWDGQLTLVICLGKCY